MMQNELRVKIRPDGSLKVDASKVYGTEDSILDKLRGLATVAGGDPSALKVEGHRHDHVGLGHHHHEHEHEGS